MSPGDEKVTQGDKPQVTTVGVGRDEANLIMLSMIGDALTDPHTYAHFGSDAGRATASYLWPGASAVAECITPGGNCDRTNLALAAIPLHITQGGLEDVLERHVVGGALSRGKSLFNVGEDIKGLIQSAESANPVKQVRGLNFERVVDAGRIIGNDRATGTPTSIYTVITRPNGELVTAFPGKP